MAIVTELKFDWVASRKNDCRFPAPRPTQFSTISAPILTSIFLLPVFPGTRPQQLALWQQSEYPAFATISAKAEIQDAWQKNHGLPITTSEMTKNNFHKKPG
jgi:hypothetical protein